MDPEGNSKNPRFIMPKKYIAMILISFVMGSIGGMFGYNLASGTLFNNQGSGGVIGNKTYNVTEQSATVDAVKKVTPAVVSITSVQSTEDFFGAVSQTKSSGTGFIVTSDGLIVTNKHVVPDKSVQYSVSIIFLNPEKSAKT